VLAGRSARGRCSWAGSRPPQARRRLNISWRGMSDVGTGPRCGRWGLGGGAAPPGVCGATQAARRASKAGVAKLCGTSRTARRARGCAGGIEEVEAAARLQVGGEVEGALRPLVVVQTPPRRREKDGVRLERRQQACGWQARALRGLGTGRWGQAPHGSSEWVVAQGHVAHGQELCLVGGRGGKPWHRQVSALDALGGRVHHPEQRGSDAPRRTTARCAAPWRSAGSEGGTEDAEGTEGAEGEEGAEGAEGTGGAEGAEGAEGGEDAEGAGRYSPWSGRCRWPAPHPSGQPAPAG
jgi:hypothetical protein